jgi:pSer/pThr/pTyr-binding forkhead associated (FHA) protein
MPQLIQKNADGTSVKQWDLKNKTLCIGRGEQADVQIGDEMMSRRHFEIVEKNGGYIIRDLQSRNGTSINGRPVTGENGVGSGDTIRAGETVFVFADGLNTVIGQLNRDNQSYSSFIKKL